MIRFATRAGPSAYALTTSILGGLAVGTLASCTVTPDYFPACVDPYVDTCPVGDAAPDGDDQDGQAEPATDASAPDASAPDAPSAGP